jgi:hypothetical protein
LGQASEKGSVLRQNALRHVPVGIFLQLRGAMCNFYRRVRAFLDRVFPDRWIGREEPIPWPRHFLDLTLNFFFWEFLGDIVNREKV